MLRDGIAQIAVEQHAQIAAGKDAHAPMTLLAVKTNPAQNRSIR
jgi:hypothetical protein